MIAQADNRLKSAMQETFCQWVAQGIITNTEAYRRAGYSENGAHTHAQRLVTTGHIKARIAQIRGLLAEKLDVTGESIANEAEFHRQLALAAGDTRTANGALVIKAKVFGLQTDKTITESTEAQRALDAQEAVEADRLAKIRLDEEMGAVTGVLEDNHV